MNKKAKTEMDDMRMTRVDRIASHEATRQVVSSFAKHGLGIGRLLESEQQAFGFVSSRFHPNMPRATLSYLTEAEVMHIFPSRSLKPAFYLFGDQLVVVNSTMLCDAIDRQARAFVSPDMHEQLLRVLGMALAHEFTHVHDHKATSLRREIEQLVISIEVARKHHFEGSVLSERYAERMRRVEMLLDGRATWMTVLFEDEVLGGACRSQRIIAPKPAAPEIEQGYFKPALFMKLLSELVGEARAWELTSRGSFALPLLKPNGEFENPETYVKRVLD